MSHDEWANHLWRANRNAWQRERDREYRDFVDWHAHAEKLEERGYTDRFDDSPVIGALERMKLTGGLR